jgi:hypothetical protein
VKGQWRSFGILLYIASTIQLGDNPAPLRSYAVTTFMPEKKGNMSLSIKYVVALQSIYPTITSAKQNLYFVTKPTAACFGFKLAITRLNSNKNS